MCPQCGLGHKLDHFATALLERNENVSKCVQWTTMKESMRELEGTCPNVFKDSLVKFSAKIHNLSVESKRIDVMENRRVTHFIVNDGNIGLNGSREHNCPNLAALAKQNKTRLEQDNCHTIIGGSVGLRLLDSDLQMKLHKTL